MIAMDLEIPSEQRFLLTAIGSVDLLVRAMVTRVRDARPADDPYRGLYIDETEIDRLRVEPMGMPSWLEQDSVIGPEILREARRQQHEYVDEQRAIFLAKGKTPRLDTLCDRFGLDEIERQALLLVLLVDFDLRYERMFGYLHDDVTRRRPSVDLVLNLLSSDIETKLSLRSRLAPGSRLLRHRLLLRTPPTGENHGGLLRHELSVDERIVAFLLGEDPLPETLLGWIDTDLVGCGDTDEPPSPLNFALTRAHEVLGARGIVHLHSPDRLGRRSTAGGLARRLDMPLLLVEGTNLAASSTNLVEVISAAIREARLRNALLYWDDLDPLLEDARQRELGVLLDGIRDAKIAVIFAGTSRFELGWRHSDLAFGLVELEIPAPKERLSLWHAAIGSDISTIDDRSMQALAGQFRLTKGRILESAATARNLAALRREHGLPTSAELFEAARLRSRPRLQRLARRLEPSHGWEELILPRDQQCQLHEIVAHVRHRALVLEGWGFARKLSYGLGLAALFSGPSGTGKTFAAGIIARELGLDIYRIDLSCMVSKYIGETEKNLSRVFDEAASSDAILFFDEADALFGKRSEVKDSHDRYANIEVGHLLQRMEDYEGITILATNARASMDSAFVRRMAFSIDFPFPEAPERRRIWARAIPPETPRTDDLDLDELATRFRVTGGNIRNIALSAAFLAASNGQVVGMEHVVRATRREYQKLGRSCAAKEFGPLFSHIQDKVEIS